MISAMEAKGPRVTIEFDRGVGEPIAGLLVNEQGTRTRFDGWLGLASALEQILRAASSPRRDLGGTRQATP